MLVIAFIANFFSLVKNEFAKRTSTDGSYTSILATFSAQISTLIKVFTPTQTLILNLLSIYMDINLSKTTRLTFQY